MWEFVTSLNSGEDAPLRDWFSTQERMQNYWGVEAAPQMCLRLCFLVRSFDVALCCNSKDYWCWEEVPARYFLVIVETLVIITILIWCLTRIHDILLFSTRMPRHLTTDWGPPGRSFCPNYCTVNLTCLCTNLGWVYVFFSAEFNFTVSFFYLCLYIKTCHWNK